MFCEEIADKKKFVLEPPGNYQEEHVRLIYKNRNYVLPKVYFYHLKKVKVSAELVFWKDYTTILKESSINEINLAYYQAPAHRIRFALINLVKRKEKKLPGNFAWVIDRYSLNYYHWIVDVLPRLLYLKRRLDDVSIALPDRYREQAYIAESLRLFELTDLIFFRPEAEFIRLENLYLVTHFSKEGLVDSGTMLEVKRYLFDKLGLPHGLHPFRKIYISRKKAKLRKIDNEDALIPELKKRNFEVLYTEDLSFSEQAKIFSECRCLVGLHGAGLTNMLFMNENTSVVELRNDTDPNFCFYTLAANLQVSYYYLLSPGTEWAMTNCHIEVNVSALCSLLDQIDG